MITLHDIGEYGPMIADWCLAQPDLLGFRITTTGDYEALHVTLDWPDGYHTLRAFSLSELRSLIHPDAVKDALESMARDARKVAFRRWYMTGKRELPETA